VFHPGVALDRHQTTLFEQSITVLKQTLHDFLAIVTGLNVDAGQFIGVVEFLAQFTGESFIDKSLLSRNIFFVSCDFFN
jgi:hypothetical protein